MATRIIDISKFNVITDWSKVKANVDGIIIRVAFRGYGSGKISADSKFSEFAKKCNQYGIPWGIYFMSSAISIAEAEEEARYSVSAAKEFDMPNYMPIFIDSEDVDGTSVKRRSDALSKPARTTVCNAFIKKVIDLGYKGGIYCSDSWTRDCLNWNDIKNTGFNWIAKYGRNDGTVAGIQASPCHMHQFTSKANIPGINGNCDLSYCYVDLKDSTYNNVEIITAALPTVKNGSKGDNVKLLQQNLNMVNGSSLVCDGIAGSKTVAEIRAFQLRFSLTVDGIYGRNSYNAMQKALKEV